MSFLSFLSLLSLSLPLAVSLPLPPSLPSSLLQLATPSSTDAMVLPESRRIRRDYPPPSRPPAIMEY
ncbi:hypothetical protein FB645_004380 [Coemansia sp. IMI 203386]|nr:hypothetical protein FB645_004380 [Coemansia sp. IMI 203386]